MMNFNEFKTEDILMFIIAILIIAGIITKYMKSKKTINEKMNNHPNENNIVHNSHDMNDYDNYDNYEMVNIESEMTNEGTCLSCNIGNYSANNSHETNRHSCNELDDKIFKFAMHQECDCGDDKIGGCSVCELKYGKDVEILQKLAQKKNGCSNCVINEMERDNDEYRRDLLSGAGIMYN